jgi:hypothetical protein
VERYFVLAISIAFPVGSLQVTTVPSVVDSERVAEHMAAPLRLLTEIFFMMVARIAMDVALEYLRSVPCEEHER